MGFSYYNPNDRYRRRSASRLGNFLFWLLMVVLIFGVGFWLGGESAGQHEKALAAKVKELEGQRSDMELELVEVRSQAQTADMRYQKLQEEYEAEIPEGSVRELLGLVRKQLEEGRDPKRLAFLIRSARPPRNCSEAESKRFIVSTPANQGADSQVSIADGAVLIKGSGASVKNDKGNAEAWFDPGQPVSLAFTPLGGQVETKKGRLPLHHSIVVGGREHRFTISEGARSFAKVTFDSCDYP